MSAESDYWQRYCERIMSQRLLKALGEATDYLSPGQIRSLVEAALYHRVPEPPPPGHEKVPQRAPRHEVYS